MSRNVLLILGLLCLGGAATLSFFWFTNLDVESTVAESEKPAPGPAVLVATRAIEAGSLLQQSDMVWRDVPDAGTASGTLVRGQISEAEFFGAVTRRSFAEGERLTSDDLVKTGDRKFLAAVLRPGKRAVAVPVEAQQSASGLVLPGDRVDVILAHVLAAEATASLEGGSVAETILRDVGVIAVDQALPQAQKTGSVESALTGEPRLPRVVTLEVDERQAQTLVGGLQLGKLQLAVRSLENPQHASSQRALPPTFASDISPTLRELALRARQLQPAASSLEGSVRRPPTAAK